MAHRRSSEPNTSAAGYNRLRLTKPNSYNSSPNGTTISTSKCYNDNVYPTSPRHRRASVTLTSTSCGLVRSIGRDLQKGWNTPTTEKASSAKDIQCQTSKPYKPRHAARDALKLCIHTDSTPSNDQDSLSPSSKSESVSPRWRQDSVCSQRSRSFDKKEQAKLGDGGLLPDRNLDIWSQGWEAAFERRASIVSGDGNGDGKKGSVSHLTGTLSVTDEDIKKWIFQGAARRGSRPGPGGRKAWATTEEDMSRRPSDVPSLVMSSASNRHELEDLEEESESEREKEKEVVVDIAERKKLGKVMTPEVVVLAGHGEIA